MLHESDNVKLNKWVIMIHGIGDTKVEKHRMFVKAARRLAKKGINSLRIDLLGYGDSEGDFEDTTVSEQINQTLTCISWLKENKNASDVGLLGFSLGGCVSACAAARSKEVGTLVLWSPVSSLYWNMLNYMGINTFLDGLDGKTISISDGDELKGDFFKELTEIDPVEEIKSYQNPIMLIQGTADTAILSINAPRYKESFTNSNSRVHMIEGANHTYDNVEHERELLELTERWFVEQFIK
jgi:hypothetical protein